MVPKKGTVVRNCPANNRFDCSRTIADALNGELGTGAQAEDHHALDRCKWAGGEILAGRQPMSERLAIDLARPQFRCRAARFSVDGEPRSV